MSHKVIFLLIIFFAFLGALNASYLTWSAAVGSVPTCFLDSGCDIVAASPQSKIVGIPLAAFGVFFYAMILGFAAWRVFVPKAPALMYILPLSLLGFILSLYFLYLQAFVINAYCEYCLFSLFDATVIFFLVLFVWLKERKEAIIKRKNNESTHGNL